MTLEVTSTEHIDVATDVQGNRLSPAILRFPAEIKCLLTECGGFFHPPKEEAGTRRGGECVAFALGVCSLMADVQ